MNAHEELKEIVNLDDLTEDMSFELTNGKEGDEE